MYVDVEHRTWNEIFPCMSYAYSTGQEITELTPFDHVSRCCITKPLDIMLPADHGTTRNESTDDVFIPKT